jgi:hypothetical protein
VSKTWRVMALVICLLGTAGIALSFVRSSWSLGLSSAGVLIGLVIVHLWKDLDKSFVMNTSESEVVVPANWGLIVFAITFYAVLCVGFLGALIDEGYADWILIGLLLCPALLFLLANSVSFYLLALFRGHAMRLDTNGITHLAAPFIPWNVVLQTRMARRESKDKDHDGKPTVEYELVLRIQSRWFEQNNLGWLRRATSYQFVQFECEALEIHIRLNALKIAPHQLTPLVKQYFSLAQTKQAGVLA